MNKEYSRLQEQLHSLPVISKAEDIKEEMLSSPTALEAVLTQCWPQIRPIAHYEVKRVQTDSRGTATKGTALSLQAFEKLEGVIEQMETNEAPKEAEARSLSLQRLSEHPSFIVPSTPFSRRPAKRVTIEGETASEILMRERR